MIIPSRIPHPPRPLPRLAVEAPLLARLVEDSTADLDHVRALCRQTFGWDAGPADRRVVQAVAAAILRRAGRLLAAGVWSRAAGASRACSVPGGLMSTIFCSFCLQFPQFVHKFPQFFPHIFRFPPLSSESP